MLQNSIRAMQSNVPAAHTIQQLLEGVVVDGAGSVPDGSRAEGPGGAGQGTLAAGQCTRRPGPVQER